MTSAGESIIDPRLETGLRVILQAVQTANDPWWIIGSAAMALHGASPLTVADIDLLMSREDARQVLKDHGVAPSNEPMAPFHSGVFGRLNAGPMSVDVMGGFHIRVDDAWREVVPETRQAIPFGSGALYVPTVIELVALCDLFGRPKDFERQKILQRLNVG